MDSPKDDNPDFEMDVEEKFIHYRVMLVDARATAGWYEDALAELARLHPEVAARLPPFHEYTVADLRTDQLKDVLGRINPALGFTGEEQNYWLTLWDYAREHQWVADDDFDSMTREELAKIIDTGLPSVKNVFKPAEADVAPLDPASTSTGDSAIRTTPVSKQQRNTWARSRSKHSGNLYVSVRQMKAEGLSQLQMCERLDAQKVKLPDLVGWRHMTWRASYMSPKYKGAVKKWLSKITTVTL